MLRTTSAAAAVAITIAIGGTVLGVEPRATSDAGPHYYRAKQVLGAKVTIAPNAAVGVVDDIVLDENGNVDYLIVINDAKKLVTVPWDAAEFDAQKRTAVVHIPADKFQQVPTYTVEQYPAFSTPTYRTEVYRYYGLTPAQERRMIRRANRAR